MPAKRNSEIRARSVRKDKPDVRALARLLIDIAIKESADEPSNGEQTAERSA